MKSITRRVLSLVAAFCMLAVLSAVPACKSADEEPKTENTETSVVYESDREHFDAVVRGFADRIRSDLKSVAGLTVLPKSEGAQTAAITIGVDPSILNMLALIDTSLDASALNGMTAHLTLSKDAGGLSLFCDAKSTMADIVSASAGVDRDGNRVYASVTPLFDGSIVIDEDNEPIWTNGNALLKTLFRFAAQTESVSAATLSSFIDAEYERIRQLIPAFFTDVKMGQEPLTVEGVTEQFTTFSAVITPDAIYNVLFAWLEGVQNDAALKEFLKAIYPVIEPMVDRNRSDDADGEESASTEEAGDGFKLFFDKLFGDIETVKEKKDEIIEALPTITVKAYTDERDKLRGCDLSISYFEQEDLFTLRTAADAGNYGFDFEYRNSSVKIGATSSGTIAEGRATGKCSVLLNDENLISFSLSEVSVAALQNGRLDGKIIVKPRAIAEMIGEFVDFGSLGSYISFLDMLGDVNIEGSGYYTKQHLRIAIVDPTGKGADSISIDIDYAVSDVKSEKTAVEAAPRINTPEELIEAVQKNKDAFLAALKDAGLPIGLITGGNDL